MHSSADELRQRMGSLMSHGSTSGASRREFEQQTAAPAEAAENGTSAAAGAAPADSNGFSRAGADPGSRPIHEQTPGVDQDQVQG